MENVQLEEGKSIKVHPEVSPKISFAWRCKKAELTRTPRLISFCVHRDAPNHLKILGLLQRNPKRKAEIFFACGRIASVEKKTQSWEWQMFQQWQLIEKKKNSMNQRQMCRVLMINALRRCFLLEDNFFSEPKAAKFRSSSDSKRSDFCRKPDSRVTRAFCSVYPHSNFRKENNKTNEWQAEFLFVGFIIGECVCLGFSPPGSGLNETCVESQTLKTFPAIEFCTLLACFLRC